MKREDRFVLSHRPYAVDLSSLRVQDHFGRIDAVWFRRRSTGYGANRRLVTVACIGTLWDLQNPEPGNGREFLENHIDGRHGGDCVGRWDGETYWGDNPLTVVEKHLALLRPMLANYPAIPEGYDGWWRF